MAYLTRLCQCGREASDELRPASQVRCGICSLPDSLWELLELQEAADA